MRLEIVEGLATVDAAVLRLACRGAELGKQLRILGLAPGTRHHDIGATQRADAGYVDAAAHHVRRGNAETLETRLCLRGNPVGAPRRRQLVDEYQVRHTDDGQR